MSQRMKLFILILVINIVMVLVYLIWNHLRKKEKVLSTWMKAAGSASLSAGGAGLCFSLLLVL